MIKSDITFEQVSINTSAELLAVLVMTNKNSKALIVSAYRPPNSDPDSAACLCDAIRSIAEANPGVPLWIAGDLNLPDINLGHQYPKAVNDLLVNLSSDLGLEQMVDKHTRGSKTLGIFLTNRPTLINGCEILPGIRDHEAVLTVAEVKARFQKSAARVLRLWDKGDLDQVKCDLLSYSQAFVLDNSATTPVDKLLETIVDNINDTVDKNILTKTTSTRFSQPWINRDTSDYPAIRNVPSNRPRKAKKVNNWDRYKRLKKEYQAQCRRAHDSYVANLLSDNPSNNPKRFYSYVKSKRCDNSRVAPLRREGRTHADPKTKAEILNDQFSSVFTREDTDSLPSMPLSSYSDAPDITIEPNGVAKLLAKLNPHKAKGPDNIEAKLLKIAATEMAPAISLLFQASLDPGVVPEIWKKAFVSPIFKKGDEAAAANY